MVLNKFDSLRWPAAWTGFHALLAVIVISGVAFADPIGGTPANRLPNLTDNVFDLTGAPGPLSSVPVPDRKSTRLNSSHIPLSRMPSSA